MNAFSPSATNKHYYQRPHKKQRLDSSSPHRSNPRVPSRAPPHVHRHDPTFTDLANDRLASRSKLRSTWEDLIAKYSSIPDDETDEVDLETGEIIVDHGHLRSLQDSVLWDPTDSDPDEEEEDDTTPLSPARTKHEDFPPSATTGVGSPQMNDEGLPSEEEIIKQFGEEYGREILTYLHQRKASTTASSKSGRRDLWKPPQDEEVIFSRAKELWREFRVKRAAATAAANRERSPERVFDKASFERAVFGLCNSKAFEEMVFGQVFGLQQREEKRERGNAKEVECGEGGLHDAKNAFEEAVFGQKLDFEEAVFGHTLNSEEDDWTDGDVVESNEKFESKQDGAVKEENRVIDVGALTTYTVDDPTTRGSLQEQTILPPRLTVARTPEIIDLTTPSPIQRSRTTPPKRSSRNGSATSQNKLRKPVISGLVVDASDEEEDFFSTSPSTRSSGVDRAKPPSPRRRMIRTESDDEKNVTGIKNVINFISEKQVENMQEKKVDDGGDTLGRCGDVGYRCSKAFCFQCIA